MLKTYINLTFRSLLKHKLFAIINLAGLAVGLSASIAIGIYSFYVFNYDKFHKNADSIYMVYKERITPTGVQPTYDTWVPLLNQLKTDFPQIDAGSRFFDADSRIKVNDEEIDDVTILADPQFFEMFSFNILHGDSEKPIDDFGHVVLSKEAAITYFGNENAVGETIRIINGDFQLDKDYVVSAVLDDYPGNTTIEPNIVINFESIPAYSEVENLWDASFIYTYVKLNSPEAVQTLDQSFPDFVTKTWDEETSKRTNLKLLPLTESYDTFLGDVDNAYTLLYAGIGILIIALINFMNMATARSMDRAKEIGVKKVLGAMRGHLRNQFLSEAILFTFIGLGLALVLVFIGLPYISDLIEMELNIDLINNSTGWLSLLGFGVISGLLAGFYPAIFLSRIKTLDILRGSSAAKSKGAGRNGLVVLQFALATILITGSLIINFQISHMVTADMGFEEENLIVLPLDDRDFPDQDIKVNKLKTFSAELAQQSFVEDFTFSRNIPTEWTGSHTFVRPVDWDGDPLRMRYTYLDASFFDTYGIELIDGIPFMPDVEGNQRNSVILNEAALKAFGWQDAEDKVLQIGNSQIKVVGVVKDFHYETLRNEIQPTLHFHRIHENPVHRYLAVKTTGSRSDAMASVQGVWESINPELPFEPLFIDRNVERMYEEENRLLTLSSVFTFIGMIIAALGLYGLAAFILEKRQKEISIRKVVGASLSSLLYLIAGYFLRLVLIGFSLGAVVTYFGAQNWLNDFSNRIEVPVMAFVLSLTGIIAVLILTVGYRSLKVSLSNPVRFLRQD
ncbi:MAG: ABC transporter permease [Cyclobacteriaceae bacterium]